MKNQLIILGHPSDASLNKVILSEVGRLYEKYNQKVVMRDLYEIGFNPVLTKEDIAAVNTGTALSDVLVEQEYIRNADIITFIYPIWWTGMPAIMKGYIDRVLSQGFAYDVDEKGVVKKLLSGKKVIIINTHGRPASLYLKGGVYDSMNLLTDNHIFEFCGMDTILHLYLENINEQLKEEDVRPKLNYLKQEIKKELFITNNSRLNIPTTFF